MDIKLWVEILYKVKKVVEMGEPARGQSYDVKEQHEEVISLSRDVNKWISTMAFPINSNGFMVSWTALSNWTLSQAERSLAYYQCPGDKRQTESIDHKSTWWAVLLLWSLIPMTRSLNSVSVAGMFAIVPMILLPKMRSETYALHDLLTHCRPNGPCVPWTPWTCCFNLLWQCIHS